MWLEILHDGKFFEFLQRIDDELATVTQQGRCQACGGPLHRADYPRKPRGGSELGEAKRRSFCCGREGCRKRHLPPSVMYLGRRVYYGVVVVLVMAMREGPTCWRAVKLRKELGVSRQTLARWKEWWTEIFPASAFWRDARSLFLQSVEERDFPQSLLDRWKGPLRERVVSLLRFLGPVTRSREQSVGASQLRV